MSDVNQPFLAARASTPDGRQRIAIFDLDRTLTRYGTWSPFLIHAAWRRAPWRLALIPLAIGAMASYKLTLIDRTRLKEIMHRLMLGRRVPVAAMRGLAEDFADRQESCNLRPEGVALVAELIEAGELVILATAAYGFYARAIARRLDIAHVVATEAAVENDHVIARVVGGNCYGPVKRDRIIGHLEAAGLARDGLSIAFLSDDPSDEPTFRWCDLPVAVNPRKGLRAKAARRGWMVIDWLARSR